MKPITDARGLALSGLDADQAEHYDALLTDLYLYRPGVQARLQDLLDQAPGFVLGQVLRGYAHMGDGLSTDVPEARRYLALAQALPEANERERLHMAALQAWVNGRVAERLQALEDLVLRWPLDLLAYRQLTSMLFWTGDKRRQLAAAMQAVAYWDPSVSGHALVLGPLAFALQEAGSYELAETHALQALEQHPLDLWALHALAHVHEMQGRLQEGERSLSAVADRLNDFNLFRGHVWWHLALFKVGLGRLDEALALFDQQIFPGPSVFYLDIQNAASLLARLEIQGVNVGERWQRVADAAEQTVGQHLVAFTWPHQALALARTGRSPALAAALAGMRDQAQAGADQAAMAQAVSEALAHYGAGDHALFMRQMRPLRHDAASLGASHAQQDLYFQLLVDTALHLGDVPLAQSLLQERLASRLAGAPAWPRLTEVARHMAQERDPARLRALLRTGGLP